MNVSLTPKLEKYVAALVKTGRYRSASEVLREALRMMQDREVRLEELRREIRLGIESLERGEGVVLDRAELNRIRKMGWRAWFDQRRQKRKSA